MSNNMQGDEPLFRGQQDGFMNGYNAAPDSYVPSMFHNDATPMHPLSQLPQPPPANPQFSNGAIDPSFLMANFPSAPSFPPHTSQSFNMTTGNSMPTLPAPSSALALNPFDFPGVSDPEEGIMGEDFFPHGRSVQQVHPQGAPYVSQQPWQSDPRLWNQVNNDLTMRDGVSFASGTGEGSVASTQAGSQMQIGGMGLGAAGSLDPRLVLGGPAHLSAAGPAPGYMKSGQARPAKRNTEVQEARNRQLGLQQSNRGVQKPKTHSRSAKRGCLGGKFCSLVVGSVDGQGRRGQQITALGPENTHRESSDGELAWPLSEAEKLEDLSELAANDPHALETYLKYTRQRGRRRCCLPNSSNSEIEDLKRLMNEHASLSGPQKEERQKDLCMRVLATVGGWMMRGGPERGRKNLKRTITCCVEGERYTIWADEGDKRDQLITEVMTCLSRRENERLVQHERATPAKDREGSLPEQQAQRREPTTSSVPGTSIAERIGSLGQSSASMPSPLHNSQEVATFAQPPQPLPYGNEDDKMLRQMMSDYTYFG